MEGTNAILLCIELIMRTEFLAALSEDLINAAIVISRYFFASRDGSSVLLLIWLRQVNRVPSFFHLYFELISILFSFTI